jgi:hemoglobin-like flavoprotein
MEPSQLTGKQISEALVGIIYRLRGRYHQAVMLAMALMISERHHTGAFPATQSYLRYVGTRHQVRGVPEDLYPPFTEVFLEVLAEILGPDWNEALAADWRAALEEAIRLMLEGYQTHFAV